MTNNYVVVAELPSLIDGDEPNLVFMCQEDGILVGDFEVHSRWHEEQRRAALPTPLPTPNRVHNLMVPCRCPDPDQPAPTYWHCSAHDRSNPPRGPILRGDGGIVDRDQVRIWSEQ